MRPPSLLSALLILNTWIFGSQAAASPEQASTRAMELAGVLNIAPDSLGDCVTNAVQVMSDLGPGWRYGPSHDAVFAAIDRCSSVVVGPTAEDMKLYTLGLIAREARSQDARCVEDHPDDFRWQEGAGTCVYKGTHFKQLAERFPDSPFADDGAYWIALDNYVFYECEGQYLCGSINRVSGWETFLLKHPESELVGNALQIIDDAFTAIAREATSQHPQCEGASYYEEDLLEFLDAVDRAAASFSNANGSRSGAVVSNARRHLKSYVDACSARQE